MSSYIKHIRRARRHRRVRAKVYGTKKRPRLCVFRSHKYIYAQLIDDDNGHTLVSVHTAGVSSKNKKLTKTQVSYEIGKLLAEKAKKKKITSVVFDRGGYKYHGRVKAVADGAREGGLTF
ncbi:50S ribosomal protein L18 [Patescibacteria group bacterium AH-259-L05]|nr:50S ribosomal protein L18 [Patescibacteria group bacterium AH-259-L05]